MISEFSLCKIGIIINQRRKKMLKELFEKMKEENLKKISRLKVPEEVWLEAENAGATFKGYHAHERVEHIFLDKLKEYIEKQKLIKKQKAILKVYKKKITKIDLNEFEKEIYEAVFEAGLNSLSKKKIKMIYKAFTKK